MFISTVIYFLIYGLLIWGVAATLNAAVFTAKPASRVISWSLTGVVFVVSVVAWSAVRLLQFQAISEDIGVPVRSGSPMDMGGAAVAAWLFYSLIKKAPARRSGANPARAAVLPTATNPANAETGVVPPAETVRTQMSAAKSSPAAAVHGQALVKPAAAPLPAAGPAGHGGLFDEREAFAQIAAEIAGDNRDEGLWLKSLVEGNGAERQRILYAQARLTELRSAHELRAAERERAELEQRKVREADAVRLAHLSAEERAFMLSAKQRCPACGRLLLVRDRSFCPRCTAALDGTAGWRPVEISDDEAAVALATAMRRSPLDREEVIFLAHASRTDASVAKLQDDVRGETLLHKCARLGLAEEARLLLAAGADRSAPSRDGKRPFELADDPKLQAMMRSLPTDFVELSDRFAQGATLSEAEVIELVRQTSKLGTDPNLRARDGRTLLHAVVDLGYLDLMDILVTAGADPMLKDGQGRTAMRRAMEGVQAGAASAILGRLMRSVATG